MYIFYLLGNSHNGLGISLMSCENSYVPGCVLEIKSQENQDTARHWDSSGYGKEKLATSSACPSVRCFSGC